MKRKYNTALLSLCMTMLFSAASLAAWAQQKQGEPWVIPAEYRTLTNPLPADSAVLKAGKTAYDRKCAICHGKTGLGDGPRGMMSRTFPGDFSSEAFQQYSDGEIFFQTKFGRGEMPSYEKKSSDTEIWSMVHYMRALKRASASSQ
jgi:mono/diheme cytochrome c family protein